MNTIEIQKASIIDIASLQMISKQTFYETFALANSESDMASFLAEGFSIEKLSKEILDVNTQFFFATFEGVIVGYLKINFGQSQTEIKDENAMEIERIYIKKDFQGMFFGQQLYDKAIEKAREHKAHYVWLGVWEENPKAIQFYKKNGFEAFDKHIFKLGNDDQIDIMMKLNL